MLVSAPIPKTYDGRAEEHHKARVFLIHRVALFPVEHVGGAVAVVELSAIVHHVCPPRGYAAAAKGRQPEYEHEERAYNEYRRLYGRQGHHPLHASEHGEHAGDKNQTDGSVPERYAEQELEEDTARIGSDAHLCQYVCHQGDDGKPRSRALGVAKLQEVGHRNDFAQLVAQQLVERHEQPAEEEYHPPLHLPMRHAYTALRARSRQPDEMLRSDVGGKDCHTDYIPRLSLTKEVVRRAFPLRSLPVFHDCMPYCPYHAEYTHGENCPVEPDKFLRRPIYFHFCFPY